MAEHQPGSMNTSTQERTFARFVRMSTWAVAIIIGVLVFLAIFNS